VNVFLMSAALIGASLSTSAIASANDDGFFNVSYNDIGFELTQIGGYGELIIKPQGFANMGYGSCTMNFTRGGDGALLEKAAVIQGSSAVCPEAVAFSVEPGAKGMYKIRFTEGGDLAGKDFDLFPVLRPMSDELKVAAPKGFDILGTTIGMSRAQIQSSLSADGYVLAENYSEKSEYTDGTVRVQELWGKGSEGPSYQGPDDSIAVTYTTVMAGHEDSAQVEALGRKWNIPASANLSVANLKKSLADKHGAVTSQFDGRFYNIAGELQPKAFQPVCSKEIHLQQVNTRLTFPGLGDEFSTSAGCGASVDILVIESYETKGLAGMMQVKLNKGDIAYGAFWDNWSKKEEAELKKRYDIQIGMNATAPKL
jgi:hypothetical protein